MEVCVAVEIGLGVLVEVGAAAEAPQANETSIKMDRKNNMGLGLLGNIYPPLM
jgi:hypothetical protein